MTGFRIGINGVQGHFGITPDLTTLGKVIGGGMPMGAFGGRRDIMQHMAPVGGVYQAGTLSGNPVAVAAGLKTLELIAKPHFYEELARTTTRLCNGLITAAKDAGETFSATSLGGMFGFFFAATPPQSFAQVMQSDRDRFNQFFHAMLERGVYLAPSAFEAGFVSKAHTDADIDQTVALAAESFRALRH
jgi:glutamate-1-semialdehyde 2,1-aminomutase